MSSRMQKQYPASALAVIALQKARCRRWVFTAWAPVGKYEVLDPRYIVVGEEVCPETGTPHWQGYIEFEKAVGIGGIRKKLFNVTEGTVGGIVVKLSWWSPAKGTAVENLAYCSKDGEFVEEGKAVAAGQRSDLLEVQQKLKAGIPLVEVREDHFRLFMQFPRALAEYAQSCKPKRDWVTNVIFCWGPTGVGKSRMAAHMGAAFVFIDKGGFINGYAGEEVVCFDEFDPVLCSREVFLRLTDRYAGNVRVLYGQENWAPRTIIFTSNNDPHAWYPLMGEGQCPAVVRRVTTWMHLTEPWLPPVVEVPIVEEVLPVVEVPIVVLDSDSEQEEEIDLTVIPVTPPFSRAPTEVIEPARKRLRRLFDKACEREEYVDPGLLYAKRQRCVVLDSDDDGEDYGVGDVIPRKNSYLDLEAGEGSDSE